MYIVDSSFRIAHMNLNSRQGAFINVQPVIGRAFDEAVRILWPEEVAAGIIRIFRHTLDTGEPYCSKDFINRRADKDQVEGYEWELHRITGPDGRAAVVCYYYDSTRLRDAQEALRYAVEAERAARSEAEQAARLRDEFLATVSHELRSPLNGIFGWAQLLKRSKMEERIFTEGVDAILSSARTQAQIIDDLLDMNRIMTGKLRLDVQDVNLVRVVEEALMTARPSADAKGIRIQTALNPAAGPIMGDAVRLQQVVWNLVGNAVKFTPRGGQVQIVLERPNSHVELSVCDNGIGIKAEFLPHVFDRFRQANSSSTRQHGGLGLGLAIAKQIVELHGGSIAVSSAGEGKGATFRIELPVTIAKSVAERHVPAPPEIAVADDKFRGVRVLIVDDDPGACDVLVRLLLQSGAQAECVHSGQEALDRISAAAPDILLCDVGMPEMDGFTVIQRLRAAGETFPAIAVTAFARTEDRIRTLQAGFDMHVSKPVDAREVLTSIATLLRKLAKA
jgi:signal transduction histidine kinase/ActR/RegA family two-component response regulator